ncbi:MAG: CHAT domain-containing protein [Spirochaetes bacterium]|nr:CHAT domain-containing protein [Spirochaetota bacterium]
MHIRIINVARENVDVLIDERQNSAVENHKLVPQKLLTSYLRDWRTFVTRVQAEKNSRPDDRIFDNEVATELASYGKTLLAILFPQGFTLAGTKCLTFSVDAEWARLPFEILPLTAEGIDFSGLKIPVVRQMRTIAARSQSEKRRDDLRQFLLCANPEGAVDIAALTREEKQNLEKVAEGKVLIHAPGKLASIAQVLNALTTCEYLHYAGHIRNQSLQFGDGPLGPEDFSALALGHVKLAFVNGCNSVGKHDDSGLARAFLTAGVQNYIGYNYPVSDTAALYAASFVWGDFLQQETSLRRRFSFSFSRQTLVEGALALRRALFEKFGAAELAWLGIQFFVATTPAAQPRRRLWISIASGVMTAAAVFTTLWLTRPAKEGLPPHGAVQKKVMPPPAEKVATAPRGPTVASSGEKPATGLHHAKPPAMEFHSQRDELPAIQSPDLRHLVAEFRKTPHPYYSKEDKERILTNVLAQPAAEATKIIRLKNEMP